MSDLLRSALFAASMALLPAVSWADTSGCRPLPQDFVLCAQGTEWETARLETLTDGVFFESTELWLEVFTLPEDYPVDASLDAILDLIEIEFTMETEAEGLEAPVTVSRDRFRTEYLDVAALTNRVAMEPGEIESFVTMVAEADGRRITISIDPGEDVPPEHLFDATRAIVELIRPASGG